MPAGIVARMLQIRREEESRRRRRRRRREKADREDEIKDKDEKADHQS